MILWRSVTLVASLHPQMMTIRHPMMGAAVTAALTVRVAVAPESGSHSTTSGSGSYIDSSVSAIITDDGSHSSDDSGSPIGSPISRCTRHKSSGYCNPHSRSHSHSPPAASQAITVSDDKCRTPSPKWHHKSCNHQRHEKHQHNSASHSPLPEKLCSSRSSKRKTVFQGHNQHR